MVVNIRWTKVGGGVKIFPNLKYSLKKQNKKVLSSDCMEQQLEWLFSHWAGKEILLLFSWKKRRRSSLSACDNSQSPYVEKLSSIWKLVCWMYASVFMCEWVGAMPQIPLVKSGLKTFEKLIENVEFGRFNWFIELWWWWKGGEVTCLSHAIF